jgi:hypothetical protein
MVERVAVLDYPINATDARLQALLSRPVMEKALRPPSASGV